MTRAALLKMLKFGEGWKGATYGLENGVMRKIIKV